MKSMTVPYVNGIEASPAQDKYGINTNFQTLGPFHYPISMSIWISNHTPSKVWNEITYPFPNFNGTVFEDR